MPAGDTFTVYPGQDGTPLESIRSITMDEVMQDIRAMKLAESLSSHEAVVKAMEDALGREITFDRCAESAEEMQKVRDAVNEIIINNI